MLCLRGAHEEHNQPPAAFMAREFNRMILVDLPSLRSQSFPGRCKLGVLLRAVAQGCTRPVSRGAELRPVVEANNEPQGAR